MNVAAHNQRVAHALLGALVRGGAARAFVSPGSRSTPLVLALDTLLGDAAHVILDERTAAFAALGAARVGGGPVLLVCTSGSAAAHYLPALIEAFHSELPLIVVTADRPPELHHCGAAQTTEQAAFFAGHVRWHCDLGTADAGLSSASLASTATRALLASQGPPGGPVHVNLAFREPLWEPSLRSAPLSSERAIRLITPAAAPTPSAVRPLAEELARVRRGVILCGPRTVPHPTRAEPTQFAVTRLARILGWPVLADACSGVRFGPSAEGVVVGAYDALLRDEAFARHAAPELVLRIGQLPASRPVANWLTASGTRSVLLAAGGELQDPLHVVDSVVRGDATLLCSALADELASHVAAPGWLAGWRGAEQTAQAALRESCAAQFFEGTAARQVAASAPEGAVLHVASSMPVRDLESFAAPRGAALHVTANRGVNGIDGTLATAVGEALVTRGRVLVLMGDLAFLHDLSSLHAARALGVALTVIVVNNEGGGIFDFLDIREHPTAFTKYFSTPQPTNLGGWARAADARHVCVSTSSELEAALAAVAPSELCVIEARIDRKTNVAAHRAAWARVRAALAQQPNISQHLA